MKLVLLSSILMAATYGQTVDATKANETASQSIVLNPDGTGNANVTWKTVNVNGKAQIQGTLVISATPKTYFQTEKNSRQEFRVILEWGTGDFTGESKRDGVVGIYSNFEGGWSGNL